VETFQVRAMHKAFIEPNRCLRCIECQAAKACHLKAIFRIDFDDPNFVDPKFCCGCGDCLTKCRAKAIKLKTN
jgi:MinD superfamily P-loop ATPase